MAAKARFRRSVKRSRDLIWITTIVQASVLESTPTDVALLVIPADWVSNTGFDRATLLGMRGWFVAYQATAGTSADATGGYGAIYMCDEGVTANSMDPSTAGEYADFDVLFTFGCAFATTAGAPIRPEQLEVKARRKMTSASSIRMAVAVDADTAAPRMNVNGVIRSLIQLDPPG